MNNPQDKNSQSAVSDKKVTAKDISVGQYVRQYFAGQNGFSDRTFESLLKEPFDKLKAVFDKLSYAASPLLGGYFPKNWGCWRNVRSDPSTDDFELSLRWNIFKLDFHSHKLATMISDRNDIEHTLLEGDFDKAKSELKSFDRTHGVSLWSLGTFFRLCEMSNGSHFNRTELLKFTTANGTGKGHQWSNYLATILSFKSESGVSHADYEDIFQFLNVDATDFDDYALNYLRYRLKSQLPPDGKAYTDVLHYESRHSLCHSP